MLHRRTKRVGEVVTYSVDFARALEAVWLPGYEYSAGQYVRPSIPNGFEYLCSDAGQTNYREPNWPRVIDDTVIDGSVIWECKDFSDNASDSISGQNITADTGITVDSSSINGTRVEVKLSGGDAGSVYDVEVQAVTAAGDSYEEVLRITVTE